MPSVQIGDKWLLGRHVVYCEDTSSNKFINFLPSEVALAIITPSFSWNHDYSIDKAHIVAVILEEEGIYNFCSRQKMPFRFELLLGDFYMAVFSHQFIPKPRKPTEIEGIEGIVAFLVARYTSLGNYVFASFMGNGEILMTCEKMRRICIAGDKNPPTVSRAINRWQNWTNQQAQKQL